MKVLMSRLDRVGKPMQLVLRVSIKELCVTSTHGTQDHTWAVESGYVLLVAESDLVIWECSINFAPRVKATFDVTKESPPTIRGLHQARKCIIDNLHSLL